MRGLKVILRAGTTADEYLSAHRAEIAHRTELDEIEQIRVKRLHSKARVSSIRKKKRGGRLWKY